MSELGVYILGMTALAVLATAGAALGDGAILFYAVMASAAAYLSQLGDAAYVQFERRGWAWFNVAFMLVSFISWSFGAIHLYGRIG